MASKREVPKQEDVLQAVVVADSFNKRFGPITEKKPRALLPLVNVPLLDYTLEYLHGENVKKVYVVCCHLADQIKAHIENSKWNEQGLNMEVETRVMDRDRCLSVGDALRDLDQASLLKSHFILICGDVVTNMKLKDILEEHKKRCEEDKKCIMTKIYRTTPQRRNIRDREIDTCLVLEENTRRLLHCEIGIHGQTAEIPMDILLEYEEVNLRNDVQETFISICTPQVPQIFTDNFDYQTMDQFVKGVISHGEIIENTVYAHIAEKDYAVRVTNMHMYKEISRDVMALFATPFQPSSTFWPDQLQRQGPFNPLYIGSDVSLAMSCTTEGPAVLGSNTKVGNNSKIVKSVIGKNCTIGNDVVIRNAFLWENVVVKDNCVVEGALLCSNVTVHSNTTVKPYCILSWDVQVGPSVAIPEGTVLAQADEDEETDTTSYGAESHVRVYIVDEEEEEAPVLWGPLPPVPEVEYQFSASEDEEEVEEEEEEGQTEAQFFTELMDTLTRATEEHIHDDNLILEINSLKHAYNITISEVHKMVVQAIVVQAIGKSSSKEALPLVIKNMNRFKAILTNYMKSSEAEIDCLAGLEELCVMEEEADGDREPLWQTLSKILTKVIHHLYNIDVLSEEAIQQWYKQSAPPDDEGAHARIRTLVAPLINWLNSAEEESEDDDEEDGE